MPTLEEFLLISADQTRRVYEQGFADGKASVSVTDSGALIAAERARILDAETKIVTAEMTDLEDKLALAINPPAG